MLRQRDLRTQREQKARPLLSVILLTADIGFQMLIAHDDLVALCKRTNPADEVRRIGNINQEHTEKQTDEERKRQIP